MTGYPEQSATPAFKRFVALALLAVIASFFFALGNAPLFDVDEGAFSQATMEMFQRGDFFSTYLNGEPRYDKPILIYWLQAASVKFLGANELAFRLPSALSATLWVLVTFLFARRYFGVERASLVAALMATSLGVYVIGRAATADALLNLLIAISMLAAWLHLETGKRGWLYATFIAIGLGFLTKGPIAILIPFAVTFLFCVLRRDLRMWARAVFDPLGLVLFALIALPWYAFILHQEGWAFVEGFFLKHNVNRFGGTLQGHAGSLVYYIPVVIVGALPFTTPLLRVLTRLRTAWRDDLQCYFLLWFGFVFVFFSLSGTKLPHYVLYGMTGMFILMVVYGFELRSRLWGLLPALLFFLFLAALPAIVHLVIPRLADTYYREALTNAERYFSTAYFVFAIAATLMTLYFMFEMRFGVLPKLVVSGIVAVVGLSAFVVPVGAGVQQEPIKEAALLSRARDYDVIMWRLNAPSFSVYYGRPTLSREPKPGDIVITKAKRLAEMGGLHHEVLYAKNGIVLIKVTG